MDSLLGDYIDVGGGFVQDHDLVAAQDSPNDADELALADTKVLALFLDLELETLAIVIVSVLVILLLIFLGLVVALIVRLFGFVF